MNKQFVTDFLQKNASSPANTVGAAVGGLTDTMKVMLGAAPLVAGLGIGTAVSKANAPTEEDHRNIQRELYSMELQETLTELKRRQLLDKKRKAMEEATSEGRSLRV